MVQTVSACTARLRPNESLGGGVGRGPLVGAAPPADRMLSTACSQKKTPCGSQALTLTPRLYSVSYYSSLLPKSRIRLFKLIG